MGGGSGNFGPIIVRKLTDAGFQVTVLHRESSKHTLPPGVQGVAVEYNLIDSIVNALKGADAVVSTLGSRALEKQISLIEAAKKIGIKRFIPSEFGSNTLHETTSKLPVYHDKVVVQQALREAASRPGGMTYTLICNGPFLNWVVMVGFLMDMKHKKMTLFDGRDKKVSMTTLASVGQAVAVVLELSEETANRAVY